MFNLVTLACTCKCLNIVAAFWVMHVSPAKHSYTWLTRKCDYRTDRHRERQTDRQTDGQTDARQSDPYVLLCFPGDTIKHGVNLEISMDFEACWEVIHFLSSWLLYGVCIKRPPVICDLFIKIPWRSHMTVSTIHILSKKVTHNFDWFYPMCVYVNYV